MQPKLSPRGVEYLARARELAPIIESCSAEIDAIRDLPDTLFQALLARDMFRLVQPREYGGAELEPMDLVQVIEEVAKHDASTAWCLGQNNVSATTAAHLEPAAVKEILGSPRGIIAWGPGPAQAKVAPGGYRLTGKFDFASGSRHATWLGAHVPIIETDGSRRTWPDGGPATYTLLFPRTSAKVMDTWHVIGLKGTGSDSYTVDDLFVPQAHAVPRGGPNRKPKVAGRLFKFTPSPLYASSFAGVALGIARATFDAFVQEMRDTTPRGASRTRGNNNVVQAAVGQSEARLRSARMFLLGSLEQIWAEMEHQEALNRAQQLTVRLASTWAIHQARETVTQLYMAAGSSAVFNQRPFEKRFRDIHTLTQQFQGQAAHFETVGQILLGMEPDRPMFTF